MSEPPPAPSSPLNAASEPTGGEATGDATPYLLVMPAADAAAQGMVWPGPEGQPAWAVPVTITPGTRGYALFLPLVQATMPPAPGKAKPEVPAPTPAQAPTPAGAAAAAAAAAIVTGGKTSPAADPPTTEVRSSEMLPAADSTTRTSPVTPPPVPAPRQAPPPSSAPPPVTAPPPVATTPVTTAPVTVTATTPVTGPPVTAVPPGGPAQPPPAWAGTPALTAAAPYRAVPRPTPVQPSFLRTRWRGPAPAQGWAAPAAVLAGALGHALFVPLGRTGIGWFLGWLTLTIGVVVAVRRNATELPRAERLTRTGWAVAALALLSVLAFRNAWWLVTFCVLGALACAALAIVGGQLVRSILFSLVAAPFAAFRGLPWVRGHIRPPEDPGLVRRIAGSVAATVAVLLVFGTLLSSADVAFSLYLDKLVPEVNVGTTFRGVFLLAVGGLIAVAAVYTLAAPPDLSTVDKPSTRRIGIAEWAPPIAVLTLLFSGFVAVQFTVLFGGQQHVLRTTGLSYAQYARSGFWQLLTVTLLTLVVLGGVTRWARRDRAVERNLLRILLGLLSALSIVIVVSALSRMYAYQKVYSFTGERIFVMAFELLLGAIFLMIIVAGIRLQGKWIPSLTVGLAVAMLLSLAVLNPEGYAASRNITRYQKTGKIDAWYLRALSADATPALAGLPDPVRRCTLSMIADDLAEPDPWYAWNLGRDRARKVLNRLGPGAVGGPRDCRTADQFDLPKSRR